MTITEGTSTPATARTRSATPKTSSGEYLTVEQAAEYLNITDHFVRRLIRERRIPFVKVGRLVRLRRSDIDEYVAGRHVPAVRR
jgi:excisionase family DNA binding protein